MLDQILTKHYKTGRIDHYKTTRINSSDVPLIASKVDHVIEMDNSNYLLAISGKNYRVLNPECAVNTPFVLVTAALGLKKQQHYIYFLDSSEISHINEEGFFGLKSYVKKNVLSNIKKVDPNSPLLSYKEDLIGLFQIHLGSGNFYEESGTVLLRIDDKVPSILS